MQVFTGGMGWDLPIWGWYRLYKSYQASTAGDLPWDIDNGCHIVMHERKTKWYRVLMFLFAWLLVLAAEVGISLYADLPRNTGRLTFAQYVDNCNNVLKYHVLGRSMRADGSLDDGWNAEGGIVTIDSATYTPEVTAETDANGYVTAVELHIDTDNVVIGKGTDVKEMLYYGYALPHEKKTMLAMTDEMLQNTEDFTATLGSLTITQKVTFENCTVIGEGEHRIYWPEEGKNCVIRWISASRKTDKNWNRRAVRRVRTAPFICADENLSDKTGIYQKMMMQFAMYCCIIKL